MDDGAIVVGASGFHRAGLRIGTRTAIRFGRLHRAERAALLALNVPHFVTPSDGDEIVRCDRLSRADRGDPRASSARATRCKTSMKRRSPGRSRSSGRTRIRLARRRRTAVATWRRHEDDSGRDVARFSRQDNFHRRSRQDRRRTLAARHSPRTGRGLDRPRLARRFRGLPARLPRPRSLQRRFRHRRLSRRACGGDRAQRLPANSRSPASRIFAKT